MNKWSLIPRVRVNYTFIDIFKAIFTFESSETYRILLKNYLANFFNSKNILLTSSGRAGLYLILRALPQQKVFIPAYTCKVVKDAVLLANKQIFYLPTSPSTFNVDCIPDLDSNSILIATHQYGIPCEIDKLAKLCNASNAILVEDCAGSFGTKYKGQLTGTFGDYAFFSFDASKLINIPSKGGFILAKTPSLMSLLSESDLQPSSLLYKTKHLLRGVVYCFVKHPILYRIFHYITMGRKQKMHISDESEDLQMSSFYTHSFYEWQARIAYRQLLNIDNIIRRRDEIYRYYDSNIKNSSIQKPPYVEESVCIRYTIQSNKQKEIYLNSLKLGVDMGFSFNHIGAPDTFIVEHNIAKRILNIPFYYNLSDKEVAYVVKVINSIR